MSLKQHLMSLASVRYTIISKKRMKDRGLNAIGPFFDAGDDTNAKKTADTVQISGMPKAGAVWKKVL